MPCHKGMGRCRAVCGHRDLVQGYRHARAAEEVNRESVSSGGWAARDDTGPKRITFKRWLKDSKIPDEFVDARLTRRRQRG